MYLIYMSILLALLPSSTSIFFDVKRYSWDIKDGNEPYRPINYFLNKHKTKSICLFMFCWNHHGNCKSQSECCECKCRGSRTFFSNPHGCLNADVTSNITKTVGRACLFATRKFGFDYVPLFYDHRRFRNIEVYLPKDNFPVNDATTACNVGEIFDHDYHGHKLLFDRNQCNELFEINLNHEKLYLQFKSTNVSIWNSFRGRLLSVNIDCYSSTLRKMFKSCFLFQVEGKYVEEAHWVEPPQTPAGLLCPSSTTATIATSPKKTTIMQTTSTTSTSTTTSTETTLPSITSEAPSIKTTTPKTTTISSTTSPPTTYPPPTLPPTTLQSTTLQHTSLHPSTSKSTALPKKEGMVKITREFVDNTSQTVIFISPKDPLTGTTIGILTGLGSGLAIVMICVIICILIKKRKDIFHSQPVNAPIFNSEGNPYGEHGFHYDVPNVNVKPVERHSSLRLSSNSDKVHRFASMDEQLSSCGYNRQYSYIGEKDYVDDQEFESRDNTILLKNRGGSKRSADMSKRPLPDKPLESGNPYYSVPSLSVEPEERISEPNDLYSLYSTIDDLQES